MEEICLLFKNYVPSFKKPNQTWIVFWLTVKTDDLKETSE